MAYVFKQKFQLRELVDLAQQPKRILIAEPESYLAGLYAYHLQQQDYQTLHCPRPELVSAYAESYRPQAVILSLEGFSRHEDLAAALKRLLWALPDIRVVTSAYAASGEQISQLMSAGVSGHFDRRLGRPQDLAVIIQAILQNY